MTEKQITITFGHLGRKLRRRVVDMDCSLASFVRHAVRKLLDEADKADDEQMRALRVAVFEAKL